MTILRAVAFAVCYVAWFYIAKRINSPDRLAKKPLRAGALNGVLFSFGLCAFVGLHAGSLDLKVALGLFLMGQSSVLITLLIGAFLGIQQDVVASCLRWGCFQLGRYRWARLPSFWSPGAAIVAYPLIVVHSIFYPASNQTLFAIQAAVGFVFWLSVPIMLWILWGVVANRYWLEGTRTQMLLLIASGALNSALYFVVLAWAFNLSGAGATLSLFGTKALYSPRILGVVFVGLILCYLAPYLRGLYLGRQTLKRFHQARREFLNRIIRVLKYPESDDAEGALTILRDELKGGIKDFQASDPTFGQVDVLKDEKVDPEGLRFDRQAFSIARPHDIRFENLDWFSTVETLLESARASISKMQTPDAKKDVMAKWAVFFEQCRAELTDHIESKPKGSALIVLGILASATVGAIFSKAGEGLWELIKDALK